MMSLWFISLLVTNVGRSKASRARNIISPQSNNPSILPTLNGFLSGMSLKATLRYHARQILNTLPSNLYSHQATVPEKTVP
jgi:hypothetical protein